MTAKKTGKKVAIKYSSDWCDGVLELGKQGLVLSSYATSLGLSVSQMQGFMKDRADFAEAVDLAMSFALSFHEQALALAHQNKGSQPQLTLAFLKSNWPSKYNPDPKTANRAEFKEAEVSAEEMTSAISDLFEALVKASDPSDYSDEQKAIMLYKIGDMQKKIVLK